MSSIKDDIAEAKFPERPVRICLRGDLLADFDEAEAALQAAMAKPVSDRLNDPARAERQQLAEQVQALREQIAAKTRTFRVRGMDRNEWRELALEHPARPGVEEDEPLSVNVQTYWPAVVRACTIEPVLDDDDYTALLGDETTPGKLTSRQFQEWCSACVVVNRAEVDVPFSQTASDVLATSANGSKRPTA